MRAVVQRCASGSVRVRASGVTRDIARGAVVLVGIAADDDDDDVEFIVRKVFNTKLFDDVDGDKSWARSIVAIEGDVLFISQFTLHAELKGNKPSYHRAMGPTAARELYERFLTRARSEYKDKVGKIEDGEFGAMMDVHIVNDGPVTIVLDSKNRN